MSCNYAIKDEPEGASTPFAALTDKRVCYVMANDNLPQIISRAQAKELGLKRYFTGKPCKRGHISLRRATSGQCIECMKFLGKEWQKNNKEKDSFQRKEAQKRLIEKNPNYYRDKQISYAKRKPEFLKEIKRRWRKNNPEKVKAHHKTHSAKRRSTIIGKINDRMGTRMFRVLRKNKGNISWQKYAGYSALDLKLHLEKQFTKGMSWENIGDWHIDHIVPLSSFKFLSTDDQSFKAAWALSNLRPCWAKENLAKNNKRIYLI